MAKWICNDCGLVYEGGPYSHYCPECRRRRLSEAAKARNLNKLGNEAYSKKQNTKKEEKK